MFQLKQETLMRHSVKGFGEVSKYDVLALSRQRAHWCTVSNSWHPSENHVGKVTACCYSQGSLSAGCE